MIYRLNRLTNNNHLTKSFFDINRIFVWNSPVSTAVIQLYRMCWSPSFCQIILFQTLIKVFDDFRFIIKNFITKYIGQIYFIASKRFVDCGSYLTYSKITALISVVV